MIIWKIAAVINNSNDFRHLEINGILLPILADKDEGFEELIQAVTVAGNTEMEW